MSDLKNLISPKSIAVIGASGNPEKIGYQVLNNILAGGYEKENVFPVNPKGDEILGLKCYASIEEIQRDIDLAIIIIPSSAVKEVIKQAAAKSVKAVIVISAGFSETGEDGRKLQEEIAELCKENNISLLGPNCLGLINTEIDLNASFAQSMPNKGNVSFVSQSGAIISSLIDWSKTASTGFSKILSIGNKALLSEADLFEYLYRDEETKVILSYVEGLTVSPKLTSVLKQYAKTKPTILLFGGKSAFGAKAASSHTGSIVSSYLSVKTYLEQAGVILAETLEDLLMYARVFSDYQSIGGKNIAIITNAGGPAIATSDSLYVNDLNMANLSEETYNKLKSIFRPEASMKNPIDILGDASEEDYRQAIEIVSADENVDAMIVLLTPQSATHVAETAQIVAAYQGKKPLLSAFVGGESLEDAIKIIENSNKPCFAFPEDAVKCLRTLAGFSDKSQFLEERTSANLEFDMANKYEILERYELPVVKYAYCSNEDELLAAADSMGYPLVAKIADETAHKSDQGGVILDIKEQSALLDAASKLGYPLILGPMIKKKHEIMLGIKKEAGVGIAVVVGTGGLYSEIYHDFAFRIAPLTQEMAMQMIAETKIGQVLAGARGQKRYDLERLAKIIVGASNLALDYQNIREIDFNPILVDEENFHMVDVRIIL